MNIQPGGSVSPSVPSTMSLSSWSAQNAARRHEQGPREGFVYVHLPQNPPHHKGHSSSVYCHMQSSLWLSCPTEALSLPQAEAGIWHLNLILP